MATIVKNTIDSLQLSVSITVHIDDYKKDFNKKIKEYQSTVEMKGFRKGKTPISYILKVFGEKTLYEVVVDKVHKELTEYVEKEGIKYILQPLPENKQEFTFNPRALEDYTFDFLLGLQPEAEILGLDQVYDAYKVSITEKTLNEEVKHLRMRYADRTDVKEDIREGDMVRFALWALDEQGNPINTNPEEDFNAYTSVLVSDIADEDFKKELLTKKIGDTLNVNPYTLEENKDKAFVRQYMLNIDADNEELGEIFHGEIVGITRVALPEINEEFFKTVYGEDTEITTEEEMRKVLQEKVEKHYENQTVAIVGAEIIRNIQELNKFPISEDFLRKWIEFNDKDVPEEKKDSLIASLANSISWSNLMEAIKDKYQITISMSDIRGAVKKKLGEQFQGIEDSVIDTIIKNLDEKGELQSEILNELEVEKVGKVLFDKVEKNYQEIDDAEFIKVIQNFNQKYSEKIKEKDKKTEELKTVGEEE